MTTDPLIATFTRAQAELLECLLDEAAGPAPGGPCRPERVDIRRAAASGRTLAFIHGAGGGTLFLHQLARHLPPNLGLVGINAGFAEDGTRSVLQDAEALIDRYVDAVCAGGQPGAPLHIGGYSSGGVIALEVARRIEARGDRVASLTLIDPARLPIPEICQDSRLPKESLARRFEIARLAGITPLSSLYPTVARVQQAIATIAAIVRADAVMAPIHLLRATQGPEALPASEIARWAARTSSGMRVSEVAADHASIIAEPAIANVGAAIVNWLVNSLPLETV